MNIYEYRARTRYYGQKQRCYNKNSSGYKAYGSRGIKVEYSMAEFVEWFVKNASQIPAEELNKWDVGRINHNKNYSLDNIEIQHESINEKEMNRRVPKSAKLIFCYDSKNNESSILRGIHLAERITGVFRESIKTRCRSGGGSFNRRHYFSFFDDLSCEKVIVTDAGKSKPVYFLNQETGEGTIAHSTGIAAKITGASKPQVKRRCRAGINAIYMPNKYKKYVFSYYGILP